MTINYSAKLVFGLMALSFPVFEAMAQGAFSDPATDTVVSCPSGPNASHYVWNLKAKSVDIKAKSLAEAEKACVNIILENKMQLKAGEITPACPGCKKSNGEKAAGVEGCTISELSISKITKPKSEQGISTLADYGGLVKLFVDSDEYYSCMPNPSGTIAVFWSCSSCMKIMADGTKRDCGFGVIAQARDPKNVQVTSALKSLGIPQTTDNILVYSNDQKDAALEIVTDSITKSASPAATASPIATSVPTNLKQQVINPSVTPSISARSIATVGLSAVSTTISK